MVSFLLLNQAFAQELETDSTSKEKVYYLIKKSDGNELYGYIISDDGREILLETKTIGKVYINKSDIKEIININHTVIENYGEFRETGPFTTRYYFTNNALPIKKGEDYAMINLYGPEVHFSLSDNFSLGVMATWIASPIALASKYCFNTKGKTHVAIGTILGSSGYIDQGDAMGGLHWLTISRGDRMSNISISAGYGYIYNNNFQDAFFIGIGGITPVGKKASFIFDSMTILNPSTYNATLIFMPSMRFNQSYEKAFQIALAGVVNIESDGDVTSFPVPMVSWLRKF